MKLIELSCEYCQKLFSKRAANVTYQLKHKPSTKFFCCSECQAKARDTRIKITCANCQITCLKLPCEMKNSKNLFCSQSCAGSFNNKLHIKRVTIKTCVKCNKPLINTRKQYCLDCAKLHARNTIDKTIEETMTGKDFAANRFREIRRQARTILKNEKKICKNCGYDKHVEVCHKTAISSFPKETPVREVNNLGNLMFLCPNCHWEHDYQNKVVGATGLEPVTVQDGFGEL